MVASTLYIWSKESKVFNIFYPPEKGGVDFLIKMNNPISDEIIPVEVGIGNKTKSQLIKAINKYESNKCILVSNRTKTIKIKDNIIYIPLMTFGFL